MGPLVGDFYRGLVFSVRQTLRDQTLLPDTEFQKIDTLRLANTSPFIFAQKVLPSADSVGSNFLSNLPVKDHIELAKSLHAFMGSVGRVQDTLNFSTMGNFNLARWSTIMNQLCTALVPSRQETLFWQNVQSDALNSFFNHVLEQSGALALRRCDRALKHLLATPQYSSAAASNLESLLVTLCRRLGYDSVQASLMAVDSYS